MSGLYERVLTIFTRSLSTHPPQQARWTGSAFRGILRTFMGFATNTSPRRRSASHQTAMRLIGIPPEEIPRSLLPVLADCRDAAEVSAVCLFLHRPGGDSLSVLQFWDQSAVTGFPQSIPSEAAPALTAAVRAGEHFELSESALSAKLESPEAALFERAGVRSMLLLPIERSGIVHGGLALIEAKSRRRWSEEDWELLEDYSNLLASLLERMNPLSPRIQELRALVGGNMEAIFHAVIDSLHEGVSCCDNEGLVVYCNPSWERITGYSAEEVRGKRIYEFLFRPGSPSYAALRSRQHERYLARRKGIAEEYESEIIRKDGSRRFIQVHASPLRNAELEVVGSIGIIADITEQRLLNARIQDSQKLESAGQTAEDVMGEFFNSLTVVSCQAERLAGIIGAGPEAREAAQTLSDAGRTAVFLARQLTAPVRTGGGMRPLSPNRFLETVQPLFAGLAGSTVELQFESDSIPGFIHADEELLRQVLLNIVINARESIDDAGRIRISMRRAIAEGGEVVIFEVADTGAGIEREHRDRIFQPFFTTKPDRSGLGLSTAETIIREHGGKISFESRPGEGSRFQIELPLSSRDRYDHAPVRAPRTLFLLERNTRFGSVLRSLLVDAGHQVQEIGSIDRLGMQLAGTEQFADAVIADISGSPADGDTLVNALRQSAFLGPVLVIVATEGDLLSCDALRDLRCSILRKPFNAELLLESIDALFSER